MEISPFISYAHEDSEFAKRIYAELREREIEPWLDTTRLLAGADWPEVVELAIWRASHVILLISSRSIEKEGYVQREVREAFKRLKQIPPRRKRHFIIPVRLDNCDVPYPKLRRIQCVDIYDDWKAGIESILAGLRASGEGVAESTIVEVDLMTELKEQVNTETISGGFGQSLPTRAAVYAEAVRLIANADIYDDARATATLFDRNETTDDLFMTYLRLVAAKCRDAEDRGGSFEHHALFAFHRNDAGEIPAGVQRGLDVRREVFASQGVLSRLHLYHSTVPILDMLLVGGTRALLAFPESPTSSRLRYGVSAIGLQSVSSLRSWYDYTLRSMAMPLPVG